MKSRKLSRKGRRGAIVTAAAASVVAGVALVPNWSAGAATGSSDATVDQATRATFQKLADAVFTDRTDALVDSAKKTKGTRLASGFSGDVQLSGAQSREEKSALATLRARRTKLAQLGEKYSSAKTSVSLDSIQVKGRQATAEVTETTSLAYEKVKGNEPKTTGFQAHHKLTFKADQAGDWQLTDVRDTDNGYIAVNQVAKPTSAATTDTADDSAPEATKSAITWPASADAKNTTSGAYDYKAMVAYATKYWSSYNPAYADYNGSGGDCTNFVSQALKAGGWKEVSGSASDYHSWFGNAKTQSESFIGVNELSEFALSSKRVTSLANVYQMDIGDVLQMDFDNDGSKDHSMIVTYRSPQGVPYVTYHSTNTYNRSVASLVASYPTATYYAYRT